MHSHKLQEPALNMLVSVYLLRRKRKMFNYYQFACFCNGKWTWNSICDKASNNGDNTNLMVAELKQLILEVLYQKKI